MVRIEDLKRLCDAIKPLPDPRRIRLKVLHPLDTIIVSSIISALSGCETWDEIEVFVFQNSDWFGQFLAFPNGVPSHDTYNRVLSIINPDFFEKCFTTWSEEMDKILTKEQKVDLSRPNFAIDGKTLRRSHNINKGIGPLHLVNVWATKSGLVLGQLKTADKSNEITAIPKLLDNVDIKGGVVTIDAMGCQQKIAQKITSKKADYILAVKDNQGRTCDLIKEIFEEKLGPQVFFEYKSEESNKHGRSEERTYYSTEILNSNIEVQMRWSKLASIIKTESTRLVKGELRAERRYYISSLPAKDIKLIGDSIREHWQIENSLHWVLDVVFREDECRKRNRNAGRNFALIRKFALNLLKIQQQRMEKKRSLRMLRKLCCFDRKFLAKTIGW